MSELFDKSIRTLELPSINSWRHEWVFQPDVHLRLTASKEKQEKILVDLDAPMCNWQDNSELVLACNEVPQADHYTLTISNAHGMNLQYVKFYSAARKNSWRAEAGWTLMGKIQLPDGFRQDQNAYIRKDEIIDLSGRMTPDGQLTWKAPKDRKWTVLRIGHVNSGRKNGPAPKV